MDQSMQQFDTIDEENDTNKQDVARRQPSSSGDWSINVTPFPIVPVPSFIRLFVIKRILSCFSNPNFEKSTQEWVNDIKNVSLKQKETAQNILLNLLKHNIKDYMKHCFDEREQANIIEIIFDQIILNRFENEYHTITNYSICDNDNDNSNHCQVSHQSNVFGNKDLMNLILQHLEWDWTRGELLNCSLVNSYWLYQAWNVKPSKNDVIDLVEIIDETIKYKRYCTKLLVFSFFRNKIQKR